MDMKFEVVVIPVADVDRAKDFCRALGWRLDAELPRRGRLPGRTVHPARLQGVGHLRQGRHRGGTGFPAEPVLIVTDIDAARSELVDRGADVSEVFQDAGGIFHRSGSDKRVPGRAPAPGDYVSFATFADPDGSTWFLQEVKTRAPGR
jgi:catechol 2,3-dioxygenase-like lactoylglutathione lyase family enzyme